MRPIAVFALCLFGTAGSAQEKPLRLFLLSGQSNMAGLKPEISFTPTLHELFPKDEVVVVRFAQGGQPILRWVHGWKAPADSKAKVPGKTGDLYDRLLQEMRKKLGDRRPESVCFVWMQGERDARMGWSAVYADSLRTLVGQLEKDLMRKDLAVVIGRLSDFRKKDRHWEAVRESQVKVGESGPRYGWVDTDDLNGPKDDLHYTKEGYAELGRRFARKAAEVLRAK